MTIIIKTIAELKSARTACDTGKNQISLVPTMGALHDGHLALVKKAQEISGVVFVSIFVNPLQFGPSEDFNNYPRTFDEDCRKLEALNVDYIFMPSADEMYPNSNKARITKNGSNLKISNLAHEFDTTQTVKANPELANRLCGLSRPGHFDGVCTVVKRLFDLVKPHKAVFGEKDYQQLKIIEAMVKEYNLPVKIVPYPIIRESDGLAMSSRNRYLSKEEFDLAASIHKEIYSLAIKLSKIYQNYIDYNYENEIKTELNTSKNNFKKLGITVEYLEIYWDRILIAAKVGKTRLIDNVKINS